MTTLQKTVITATVAALAGAGIYEARQAAHLHEQVQLLQQQQSPMAKKIELLQNELESASNRAVGLAQELKIANENKLELLKLRSRVGSLKAQLETAEKTEPKSEQPVLGTARDYYIRADHHKMNREYDSALEDLNKAIELDPNMAEAYMDRADLYGLCLPKERGGCEKAVADRTRCLEIDPRNFIALCSRAEEFRQLERYDEAIADWTVLIEGDFDFTRAIEGKTKEIARAYVSRGGIYQGNKRDYARAIADYSAALQLDPNTRDAHSLRGACYEKLGEREKAQQDFTIEPKRN